MPLANPRKFLTAVIAPALLAAPARAADYFWNPGTSSGNWVSSNWNTPSNTPPYLTAWADGNTANFTAANQTITVNGSVSAAGIDFTGDNTTIAAGAGSLSLSGSGAISVGNAVTATIAENVTGANLTKSGPGTLVLTGPNSFTTGVTISNSILQIGTGGASTLTGGTVTTSSGTILSINSSSNFTLGTMSGGGQLFKWGTGTVTLNSANSYTGPTTITDGVLSVSTLADGGSDSGIGASSSSASNLILDGGTLRYTGAGSTSTDRAFTLNAGGGTISVTASSSTTLVISGGGTGAGGLNKAGVGVLILTGTNLYSGGTTVSAGTLRIGNGTISGSVTGNIFNNAALQFNNPSTTNVAGDITGTGTLSHLAAGILRLLGTNTYAGTTTVNSGTLQIGNGGTTGSITSSVSLSASTSTLAFNRSDAVTYSGTVLGSGNLTKSSDGKLTLDGSNSYTGTTTVSDGSLYVNGTKSGTGSVTVQSGGTLGGAGTVAGAVTFNSGATFDVGDGTTPAAIGDIDLSNTLSLQGGSTMRVDVRNASTPTAGTTYDQAAVGGTVSLGGMLDVEYDPTGGGAEYTLSTRLLIISTPGVVNGVFSNYADLAPVPELNGLGGFNWLIDYQTGVGVFFVPVVPVPEPGLVLGLAAAGLGGVRLLRRRRAAA